jgi:hypothetical protein
MYCPALFGKDTNQAGDEPAENKAIIDDLRIVKGNRTF